MLAFFQITEIDAISVVAYWYITSFARIFGAVLLGMGVVLWATSGAINEITPHSVRGILYALIIAYVVVLITVLTQQVAVWQSPAGWVMAVLFGGLMMACGFFLINYDRTVISS